MVPRTVLWAAAFSALTLAAPNLSALPQQTQQTPPAPQQPVFRAGVEVVWVDVTVIGRNGEPVIGLGIDDFQVALDGRPRRVVSAELVSFSHDRTAALEGPLRTPGIVPEDSRVFVVAIDQMGLSPAAVMPAREAIRAFLKQLRPQDMVGLYEFPYRARRLDIGHDHSLVSHGLDRVLGMRESTMGMFSLAPSEIADITANDSDVLNRVISRECDALDDGCPEAVRMEAHGLAGRLEAEAVERMNGLVRLAHSLAFIQGRKTIVLLSGGLLASTRPTGRPDVRTIMASVGDDIANAQANLYVLHLDTIFMDAYSAAMGTSRRPSDRFESVAADRIALTNGLEQLAGRAGGALFSIEAGTPDSALRRILLETRAYYVLGVEPLEEDRDSKPHFIRVRTTAGGATVRSRVQVTIPRK